MMSTDSASALTNGLFEIAKASQRGLSAEQVPFLVAADRSGTTLSAVLSAVNAKTIQAAIEPAGEGDSVQREFK